MIQIRSQHLLTIVIHLLYCCTFGYLVCGLVTKYVCFVCIVFIKLFAIFLMQSVYFIVMYWTIVVGAGSLKHKSHALLSHWHSCPRSLLPPTAAPSLNAKMQDAGAVRFLFGGIEIATSRSLVKFNTYLAFLRPSHWLFSHQHSLANHCIPVSHLVDPCDLQLILFSAGCAASNTLFLR